MPRLIVLLLSILVAVSAAGDGLTPVASYQLVFEPGERYFEYKAGPEGDLFISSQKNVNTYEVVGILRRVDGSGRLSWTKTFANSGTPSVAQEGTGDIYVFATKSLFKLSPNGSTLWTKNFGGKAGPLYEHPEGGVYQLLMGPVSTDPRRLYRIQADGTATHLFESASLEPPLTIISAQEVYVARNGLIRRIDGQGTELWEKEWTPETLF